jgi:hypothetical protein
VSSQDRPSSRDPCNRMRTYRSDSSIGLSSDGKWNTA